MIKSTSVLALNDSFVTVDRLISPQLMRGYNGPTELVKVMDDISYGILIETKYYSIIVSPHQRFVTEKGEAKFAQDLKIDDRILTVLGSEPVVTKVYLNTRFNMSNIITKSGILISEGFYLLND